MSVKAIADRRHSHCENCGFPIYEMADENGWLHFPRTDEFGRRTSAYGICDDYVPETVKATPFVEKFQAVLV